MREWGSLKMKKKGKLMALETVAHDINKFEIFPKFDIKQHPAVLKPVEEVVAPLFIEDLTKLVMSYCKSCVTSDGVDYVL